MRPAMVARDGTAWRWECRRCGQSDARWQHREAVREVCEHLRRHATFGFSTAKGRR